MTDSFITKLELEAEFELSGVEDRWTPISVTGRGGRPKQGGQVMEPKDILEQTRKLIREHAGDDPNRWFYANRFVYARLSLDERKTKTEIKKHLFEVDQPCHACGEHFYSRTGVHLHRLDGDLGYSQENCVLMHAACHQKLHSEKSTETREPRGESAEVGPTHEAVLSKKSKRYEGKPFIYWWDFSPNLRESVKNYDAVEFVRKDTGESCSIEPELLTELLTKDRQTSRSSGNWGVKVMRDDPDKLAFEPGRGGGEWLLLPVVWMESEVGD